MTFGFILLTIAGLVGLAAWIWLVVVAFQNNEKGWGIALIVSLFLPISPIVGLVFLVLRWSIARRPGILYLASLAVSAIGVLITMAGAKQMIQEMSENQIALQTRGRPPEDSPAPSPEPPAPPRPARRAEPPEARPEPVAPPPASPAPTTGTPAEKPGNPPSATPTPSPALAPTAMDLRSAPVQVDLIHLGEPSPTRMRLMEVRARNSSDKAVHELKLQLAYFDARGLRLGRWTTVHTGNSVLVPGGATNQFGLQAFFVPQFTRDVRIEVEAIGFTDGTRWPEVDPSLNRPSSRP